MEQLAMDVASFFAPGAFDLNLFRHLEANVSGSERSRHELEAEVRKLTAKAGGPKEADRDLSLKIALSLQLLGRCREAMEWFGQAREGMEKRYYAAACLLALGQYNEALTELDRAESRGWNTTEVDALRAEIHGLMGDFKSAEKALNRWGKDGEHKADWHCGRGRLLERTGRLEDAIEAYEKAVALDPGHSDANFRLGFLFDLHGDDDRAMEHYTACTQRPPVHVNALLNLAVLHEDRGQYDEALECLGRVLAAHPNHRRARLYAKDIESSKTMFYDEDMERRTDRRNQILETPITDFELSVRARNCLKKMNINTLGDLLRISETELLAYKNFGETSLNEIKVMLSQKGLKLGQSLDQPAKPASASPAEAETPAGDQALLRKSVADLELSVRARKCLQRLNIASLGELTTKTESELLAVKNFGMTSLNEIKQRLGEHGLSLRKSDR